MQLNYHLKWLSMVNDVASDVTWNWSIAKIKIKITHSRKSTSNYGQKSELFMTSHDFMTYQIHCSGWCNNLPKHSPFQKAILTQSCFMHNIATQKKRWAKFQLYNSLYTEKQIVGLISEHETATNHTHLQCYPHAQKLPFPAKCASSGYIYHNHKPQRIVTPYTYTVIFTWENKVNRPKSTMQKLFLTEFVNLFYQKGLFKKKVNT